MPWSRVLGQPWAIRGHNSANTTSTREYEPHENLRKVVNEQGNSHRGDSGTNGQKRSATVS
jgi:hypothetical protein